jgi:hypothetical protein
MIRGAVVSFLIFVLPYNCGMRYSHTIGKLFAVDLTRLRYFEYEEHTAEQLNLQVSNLSLSTAFPSFRNFVILNCH